LSADAAGHFFTAEDYLLLPDNGRPSELVRGRVVELPHHESRHGYYCSNVAGVLQDYMRTGDFGRVVCNCCGVVTARSPDTVRGPDVAFYSFERVAKGPLLKGYWPAPELVFEVRSPSDRLSAITTKIGEFLSSGVKVVCVLDPNKETLAVYTEDEFPRTLTIEEELTLPELFPDFRVPVRRFFE
jgi:Uma2 family endonuclease